MGIEHLLPANIICKSKLESDASVTRSGELTRRKKFYNPEFAKKLNFKKIKLEKHVILNLIKLFLYKR